MMLFLKFLLYLEKFVYLVFNVIKCACVNLEVIFSCYFCLCYKIILVRIGSNSVRFMATLPFQIMKDHLLITGKMFEALSTCFVGELCPFTVAVFLS